MNNTFPIYDVVISDETVGLTAISLVDYPAIQENWVAFSKQQMLYMSNGDKREVVAPLLIPDQLILRKSEDGSLYYIRWRRDTILQAAQRYIANGYFNNFTYMHPTFYNKDMNYEDALEKDIYMLRLWTIEDESKDDANVKYGFNLPEGTLMCHFKVHNRKLWQKIKSKEVMGCSIEAFTNLVMAENNKQIKQDNKMDINVKQMSLLNKFVQFLNEVSVEAKELSNVAKADETESGEVSLKYFIDDEHYIEVDAEGYARDNEYNLVAEGEYKLADGNFIVIDKDSKFVETHSEAEVKEEPIEAPIAERKTDEEDEKEKEENDEVKDETEKPEGEPEGEAVGEPAEDAVEDNAEGNAEDTENGNEEVAETLVPFVIDDVEYELPEAVVAYINSLIADKETAVTEMTAMKAVTPSAKPIPVVMSKTTDDEFDSLSEAIRLLNRK